MADVRRLREQVLAALHELSAGFSIANRATGGRLLDVLVAEQPAHVHGGLVTSILRLVFLLYAEQRGLIGNAGVDEARPMPDSITRVAEDLEATRDHEPTALEQGRQAWPRLLSVFRDVHGGVHGRRGRLFDPDAYPFLEGRARPDGDSATAVAPALPVPDATVRRVLDCLRSIDGEPVAYAELDVEHLGAMYELMMGHGAVLTRERSVTMGPHRRVVGITSLLAIDPCERASHFAALVDMKLGKRLRDALEVATTESDLIVALAKSTSAELPRGTMLLTGTDERRRSGSHYTPQSLTDPVVRKTLAPLLADLGERPAPDAILNLTVCDPAMGSGAFLLAACRELADALVRAWNDHGGPTSDEPRRTLATRLVAQRCLYGVDKNPLAVELAKLSVWLVTRAKDYPFTFLDHSLRQGDSLVGLSLDQIARLSWSRAEKAPPAGTPKLERVIQGRVAEARALRKRARILDQPETLRDKERLLQAADDTVRGVRRLGDWIIDAFFGGVTDKEREKRLGVVRSLLEEGTLDDLPAVPDAAQRSPFHWELEFPEVFDEAAGA